MKDFEGYSNYTIKCPNCGNIFESSIGFPCPSCPICDAFDTYEINEDDYDERF